MLSEWGQHTILAVLAQADRAKAMSQRDEATVSGVHRVLVRTENY